jgi:trehalose 6-phosphate synthase
MLSTPDARVIVVANRQPFSHERDQAGRIVARRSTSGLVAASEPLLRRTGGVWIGHGSGEADREVVDSSDGVMVPPERPEYRLRRIWLTPEEEKGYYYGFANEGLWPLCHRVHVKPVFRSADFDTYWAINGRFADAAVQEAQGDGPIVLVQDYHFALAPLMIREREPDSAILAFWHIPWPSVERLEMCPWATYLLEGLLGADVLGFQTRVDCAHFLDAAEHMLGAAVDRRRLTASFGGRQIHLRDYPASVEWPPQELAELPAPEACAASVRARLGLAGSPRIVAGVDRMDYTKGLEEKIEAVESLLERFPGLAGSFVFVQVAQPSRQRIAPYAELRDRVVALADRVNDRFSTPEWQPIVLLERQFSPTEVAELLRGADVCLVGSLHDGMNLVAKEFVSLRDDGDGVLVLSTFTGAAQQLTDAILINPYDREQTGNALVEALSMPAAVRRERMRRLRATVSAWTSRDWGTRMFEDAARLCHVPALAAFRAPAEQEAAAVSLASGS